MCVQEVVRAGSHFLNHNRLQGLPIPSPLLKSSLNANLFPIAFYLPGGRIFIAANTYVVSRS